MSPAMELVVNYVVVVGAAAALLAAFWTGVFAALGAFMWLVNLGNDDK